ncbi:hypothetical protein L3N51_01977 [Metallosphaera sp. J1]|nr:hypothetical protein [Metallosphaera javensis (ex Hofmann et al. 2022)]
MFGTSSLFLSRGDRPRISVKKFAPANSLSFRYLSFRKSFPPLGGPTIITHFSLDSLIRLFISPTTCWLNLEKRSIWGGEVDDIMLI